MTEKRFTQRLYETGERFLEDNETDCFYKIEESFGHVELLCERLNKIVDENEQLKKQLMENNCDNCKYSKAIYADVECRKKGLTEWKYNCDEFKGDVE